MGDDASCGTDAVYTELESLFSAWGGSAWLLQGQWGNRSVSACNWHGIRCEGNNVTQIVLQQNNLQGDVSAAKLPCISQTIVSLDVYGNEELTGTLPVEWSAMHRLER